MKIYLAAPYSRKDEMRSYAAELRARGIDVTSSWLEEPHKLHELSHAEHQQYALNDIRDVMDAEAMIFFTDPTKTILRAGRHVEFGMVLFWNALCPDSPMPIFVVGMDFENIFHHCPNVYHFEDWELAVDAIHQYAALHDEEECAGL